MVIEFVHFWLGCKKMYVLFHTNKQLSLVFLKATTKKWAQKEHECIFKETIISQMQKSKADILIL